MRTSEHTKNGAAKTEPVYRQRFETRASFIVVGETWPSIPPQCEINMQPRSQQAAAGKNPYIRFMIRAPSVVRGWCGSREGQHAILAFSARAVRDGLLSTWTSATR